MESRDEQKVSLTPEQRRFVTGEVEAGRFQSADEVVGAGLRLLQDWEEFIGDNRDEIRRKIDEAAQQAARGELIDGEEVFREWQRREDEVRRRMKKGA
jgi:putative addiction module CopG family antidote